MKSKFDLLVEKYLNKTLIVEKKRLTLKKLLDIPKAKKVSDYYENDTKGGKDLALDIISKIKSGELRRLKNEIETSEEEERVQKQEELANNPVPEPVEEPPQAYDNQAPETEVAPDDQEVVTEPNNQEDGKENDEEAPKELEEDTVIDEEEVEDQTPEEQAKAYIARVKNLPWAGEDNVFQKAYDYLTKVRQEI